MTNSREMAEQAFALLQSALEESESKRATLEQQIESSRMPASEPELALEDLRRELDQSREERDLWQRTAGQLQDVVSNERSKARRLAEKLKVTESGSDRNARKEIAFWRKKAEEFEDSRRQYQQRILELRQQLETYDERTEAIETAREQQEELARIEELLEQRDTQIAELNAAVEDDRLEIDAFQRRVAHLDSEVRSLSQQVIEAESARNEACHAADAIDAELKDVRAEAATNQRKVEELQQSAERQTTLADQYRQRIDELETQHEREIAALREAHSGESAAASQNFEQKLDSLRTQHAEEIERREAEAAAKDEAHAAAIAAASSQVSAESQQRYEQQIAELTQQLESRSSRIADLERQLDEQLAGSEEQQTELRNVSAQLVDLESQLAGERERSDNLNQIANEHREALAKTTEKLEEMEERYEDAKWHLGRARHFERLVRRRRMLIGKLIQNIRARHKANNALKAGLDSLRRYKANADERQQELLRRIEILENSLSEAKEKLVQMHQARRSTDPATTSLAVSAEPSGEESADAGRSSELDDRIRAQAEKIASLEDELRNAKVAESEAQARLEEVDRLQADLAAKNAFIETLQKDIEETQTAVGQLRRREAEIRDLRSQIDELRQQAAHAQPPDDRSLSDGSTGEASADRNRLAEHEETIERLTSKLKEYESTITTLSEAADSWKRRYDFLAAENSYDSAKSASST